MKAVCCLVLHKKFYKNQRVYCVFAPSTVLAPSLFLFDMICKGSVEEFSKGQRSRDP